MNTRDGEWEPCEVTVSFTNYETGLTETRTVMGKQQVKGTLTWEAYDRLVAFYRKHGIPFGAEAAASEARTS
jgi:hypothetical protein